MKKKLIAMGLMVGMMMPSLVWAQGPGGGGGGSRQRSMKMRLTGLVRGIGELEKGRKAALTNVQAKRVVGFINPWKAKPKMTENEAKALYMQVNSVLTTKQKNELDKIAALRRRSGGGGGGFGGGMGGGRPGGGGPPDPQQIANMRAQMRKMTGFFKTYNPFYPPANYREIKDAPERMREGMMRRYQGTTALLTSLSKKAR